MNFKHFMILSLAVLIPFLTLVPVKAETSKGSILFDAGHAQDAGNASWIIEGGYSDLAQLLRNHGFQVAGTTELITKELLDQHNVLVIPEPNSVFTVDEQKAIIDFITNGGSVFFIGNHIEADRNRNGIDAVGIFNQFVGELGFRFEDEDILEANLSAEPVPGPYIEHPVTYKVDQVACWSGTSIEIHDTERITGLGFFSKWLYGQPFMVVGTYGQGRFVAIGDSAIFDDGSGVVEYQKNLHKGLIEYDHKQFALNIINWLTNNPVEDLTPEDLEL